MTHARKIEDLLLLRLWHAGEKGITENAIYKDISSLLPIELNAEMLKGLSDGLAKGGLLTSQTVRGRNKYLITFAGTEQARSLIRSSKSASWRKLLVAYCLGLTGSKKINPNVVRLALLNELCSIPEGTTLIRAVDRFLMHHLQQPGAKDLEQAVIRRALGMRKQDQKSRSLQSIDLVPFTKEVTAAARRTPDGWVGNKVFISHVWKAMQEQGMLLDMTFDEFKGLLIRANQQRLLSLSRADLAPLLDQQDVRASQIEHMDATFHFLVVDQQEA
jgi:hypothetical protein